MLDFRKPSMTDEELLKALGPEAFATHLNQRMALRYSLLKVLAGTLAVTIVTATLPAVIDRIRISTQDQKDRRDYAAKFVDVALNNDVDFRIRFAKYFADVAPEEADRALWTNYLATLEHDKADLANKTIELAKLKRSNPGDSEKITKLEGAIAGLNAQLQATSKSFDTTGPLRLSTDNPVTRSQKLLHCAETEYNRNVTEVGSTNRGPRIDAYLAAVNLPTGLSWSGAFVSYCIKAADGAAQIPLSGAFVDLVAHARASNIFFPNANGFAPHPGDILFGIRRDGTGHIVGGYGGIVVSYDAATKSVVSIEGNHNNRIVEENRPISRPDIVGFARLKG